MQPSAASIRLPEGASALGGIDEVREFGEISRSSRAVFPACPAS